MEQLDTCVVGGFSKLFSYFVKNYKPSRVVTFSDNCKDNPHNMLVTNGFVLINNSSPKKYNVEYWYTKRTTIVENPNKFYDKIWDCGFKKYSWKLPNVN